MNIFKWLEKKGVSPVIAVVLMIAVAVAIAVIVYAWASGFASKKTGVESGEIEHLVLENQKLSGGALTVWIRDKIPVSNLSAVYIEPSQLSSMYDFIIEPVMPLYGVPVGSDDSVVCEVDIYSITNQSVSAGDEITLATEEGTQIKFKVKD